MGKSTAFEVPPRGAGFVTVTDAVPAWATSAASIVAFSWLLEKNSVARGDPFQLMIAVDANSEPFTVRVNAAWPGLTVTGISG
jgi:hypothetical protein